MTKQSMVELNECSSEESARSTTSNSHNFSIFKWFKRGSSKQHKNTFGNKNTPPETESSHFSSSESVDTFYSTTTVRSFAFHRAQLDVNRSHPTIDLTHIDRGKVGPFAEGAFKIQDRHSKKITSNAITTLPANGISRKRDTIAVRYSLLQSCAGSCNNLLTPTKRRVHVRGKRRAPNPPISVRPRSLDCQQPTFIKRKRRPAPKPPLLIPNTASMDVSEKIPSPPDQQKVTSNDTLILQDGLLLAKHFNDRALGAQTSCSALPRPWYKRNSIGSAASPAISSMSQNPWTKDHGLMDAGFKKNFTNKDKKKDAKRQSSLSILAKISELDKEAAAIVQQEQARSKAAMLLEASRLSEIGKRIAGGNQEVVQDIVTSTLNSDNSSKRGTRALISKFNAIGNMTRVTVNTNLFRKRCERPEVSMAINEKPIIPTKFNRPCHKNSNADDNNSLVANPSGLNEQQTIIADVTNRLSVLQNIVKKHSSTSNTLAESTSQIDENLKKSFSNSAKLVYSCSNKVTQQPVPNTRTFGTEKFDKVKTSSKLIQREIDRQFRETGKSRTEEKNQNCKKQVKNVLDIVIEAEEDGRKKGQVDDSQDKVCDLKEILKEMKHSLPKRRPREKKQQIADQKSLEIPSSSKFTQCLKITEPTPLVELSVTSNKEPTLTPTTREKEKISFGVQTSGNIRKIQTAAKEHVTPEIIKKRNFHLMRPREFAAIEAIMTMKNHDEDNTYANVIEQSIYANAIVLPSRSRKIITIPAAERKMERSRAINDEKISVGRMDNDMDTLAVSRLMKKLEGAIASGNHKLAAELAKELAKLKVRCSVVRKEVRAENSLNVDMFIEDRLAHQGPIPLQLPVNMTVGQLKDKIFNEFQIPVNVQRWIIEKKLADDDATTLRELNATDGLPVFLYLAAPVLQTNFKNDDGPAGIITSDNRDVITGEEQQNDDDDDDDDDKVEIYSNDELSDEDEIAPLNTHLQILSDEEEQMADDEKASLNNVEVVIRKSGEPRAGDTPENLHENERDVNDNEEGAYGPIVETKMEYNELIMLENCELVPNVDAIECPICFIIYGPMEGIVLRDCLHAFCRPCIQDTIKYCTEAEIKCPYRDTEYTCESTLQEREIRALVEPQVYQQHLAKSISQAENNAGKNAFHCKTPNCPGWCIYDDNANNFLCPVCDLTNCLTCRVIHSGKNCWEYQEDVRLSKETDEGAKRTAAVLTDMMDRGEAMACPTCEVILMKKWGCDWLLCSMCKTEICWVTRGPRWGPAGTGDISGGCRCGVNGRKCHPQCSYCH